MTEIATDEAAPDLPSPPASSRRGRSSSGVRGSHLGRHAAAGNQARRRRASSCNGPGRRHFGSARSLDANAL